ncbi:hypothetical protein EJB05_08977, partial [Eragrostis curvula]
MASAPRPRTKTASTSTTQIARATHSFAITSYSQHKGLAAGEFIRSAAFDVGGHQWCIRYYPSGDKRKELEDYVSIYLELLGKYEKVTASFDLRLVDQSTGLSSVLFSKSLVAFDAVDNRFSCGCQKFMRRSELEASAYLRDNQLIIESDVTVFKEPLVLKKATNSVDKMSPPDLYHDLDNLLVTKVGADVTIKVQEEVFVAHTIVLAMRSPVFKAEFYGPMNKDNKERYQDHIITIEDMQPAVFNALLQFIYTDSFAECMKDLDEDDTTELTKHLLAAADRFDIQGLKFVCEKDLCECLYVDTVAAMLVLADQHNCIQLKDACIEFITCLNSLEGLVESEGYQNLKESHPNVLIDIFERVTSELFSLRIISS